MHGDEEIADTYLRHYELKQDADFWAFDEMMEITRHDPVRAWRLMRLMVAKAPSLRALGYIGAGPIEDLLPQFIETVAADARDNERLQLALSTVCLDEFEEEGGPVWQCWIAIRKEFDLDAKRAVIYPETST
jgi:hypothetical protein